MIINVRNLINTASAVTPFKCLGYFYAYHIWSNQHYSEAIGISYNVSDIESNRGIQVIFVFAHSKGNPIDSVCIEKDLK